jgi:hypothetical protein
MDGSTVVNIRENYFDFMKLKAKAKILTQVDRGYKSRENKSDKLFSFVFSDDIQKWHGRQTNIRKEKSV